MINWLLASQSTRRSSAGLAVQDSVMGIEPRFRKKRGVEAIVDRRLAVEVVAFFQLDLGVVGDNFVWPGRCRNSTSRSGIPAGCLRLVSV